MKGKPRTPDEISADMARKVRAAIDRFLSVLDQHEPPTPRQRAARRGLRVIEGGKTT